MSSALSPALSQHGKAVEAAWRRLSARRRLYTGILILVLGWALATSLGYADDANAGSFFDRLPHFFDFTSWLVPDDWNDVWRARSTLRHRMTTAPRRPTTPSAASRSPAGSTCRSTST